jgi:hypothetical protein
MNGHRHQIKGASNPCAAPSFRECQDLSNITSKGGVWWSNGLAYLLEWHEGCLHASAYVACVTKFFFKYSIYVNYNNMVTFKLTLKPISIRFGACLFLRFKSAFDKIWKFFYFFINFKLICFWYFQIILMCWCQK